MKKTLLAILLAGVMLLSFTACGDKNPLGDPEDTKSFEEAQQGMKNIEASEDKDDIEKTIKDVFGVSISLPKADSYSADTMELGSASMYMIMISGAEVSDEEYYNSVKSKFSGWTAIDSELSFSYETETVAYGAVIVEESEYLTITFSMTDKDILSEFVSNTDGFRNEIKRLSGLEITFPDIVTSVALASSTSNGAKVEYSGMLISGSSNLNAEGFQTIIDALTPQLTGYTKGEPTQGSNSTKVQWVNNEDDTKYFEIVLSDYDGSTWVDFGFCYTDRSLLVEWPASEIDTFVGAASALPAYTGNYRNLETQHNADWSPDEFSIEISSAEEEEFNAWLASLEAADFAKEEITDEYTGRTTTQYTKMVAEGIYLTVVGEYWTYGNSSIQLTKEVYTNLNWPTDELTEAFGKDVADMLPQVEKAPKRSFVFDGEDRLTVENNAPKEIYEAYGEALLEAGFTLTSASSYADFEVYTFVYENWDELKISIEYIEDSYDDETSFRIDIEFKEYAGIGIQLPENVVITYQSIYTLNGSQGNPSDERIVKIGENYYVTGIYTFDYYYQYDPETRTWTTYIGTIANDGTITWRVDSEELSRANVDQKLKSDFSSLRLNSSAKVTEPKQTEVINGVTCVKYTYSLVSYNYEYWVDEDTGLVYKYRYFYETTSIDQVITEYDDSIDSFEDAGITADMLPTE